MAFDLAAVKRKLAKLEGKRASDVLWRPKEAGQYKLRIVPAREAMEKTGLPLFERSFYYDFGSTISAPCQFGEPDPVAELWEKCQAEGDRTMFKHLTPKGRDFAAVIVRGEEEKGVQLWSLNKKVAQTIYGFFMDSDYGDISDVNEGWDLKVKLTVKPLPNGKTWLEPTVQCSPKQTKLGTKAQVEEWLENVPDLDEVYPQKTYEQVEQALNAWLDRGGSEPRDDEGSTRGSTNQAASTPVADKLDATFAALENLKN